ncbi:MAG TPA: type II toxin-antitoxin system VapC family toxin [Solirubrobacterales bacterium]|nr:type II toxin-antitoxin system VapC family toxin [Solirubrobacterales bacterium]
MILDSSAIVSVIEEEDGAADLAAALARARSVAVGAPTLFETAIVLIAREGKAGRRSLVRFLEDNEVAAISFGARHWAVAAEAFIRFGKGRHPARLNYGDCMTYATARLADDPLLCVGNDFARTDLQLALA